MCIRDRSWKSSKPFCAICTLISKSSYCSKALIIANELQYTRSAGIVGEPGRYLVFFRVRTLAFSVSSLICFHGPEVGAEEKYLYNVTSHDVGFIREYSAAHCTVCVREWFLPSFALATSSIKKHGKFILIMRRKASSREQWIMKCCRSM